MKRIVIFLTFFTFCCTQSALAQEQNDEKVQKGPRLFGYIQTEYAYTFLGEDEAGRNLDESKIYFNRVRLGARGRLQKDFTYAAVAELSPTLEGPYLLVAKLAYDKFAPYATFTAGQMMSPFGLELNTPCNKLYTIDRSLFVRNLSGHFRDIGVMVSGGTGNMAFFGSNTENYFGYKIAIMSGAGMNKPDDNRKKDLIARLTWHPWDFITIGGSFRTGKHPSVIVDSEDERMGFAIDMDARYKGFILQSQYNFASDKGSYTTGGGCCSGPVEVHQGSVDRDGFMAQLMYMTKWNIQPVVKFETYDPDMRVTAVEDPALYHQTTYTLGMNYFPNAFIRCQMNYRYTTEEDGGPETENNVLILQVQVDF